MVGEGGICSCLRGRDEGAGETGRAPASLPRTGSPRPAGGTITMSRCLPGSRNSRKTHGTVPENAAILDSLEAEAEIYRKYKRYYGYTFFVMQNV